MLIDHLYPHMFNVSLALAFRKTQRSFGKATVLDHSGINLSVFQLVSKRCVTFSWAKWRTGWNLPKNHRVNHPYYAAFSAFEGFGARGWIDLWEVGTYEENNFNLTQKVILILGPRSPIHQLFVEDVTMRFKTCSYIQVMYCPWISW